MAKIKMEELLDDEELRQKVKDISENDVVALEDMERLPDNVSFQTEAYAVFLCIQGKGTCQLEGKNIEIRKNDLVFVQHQQFIENVMTSFDFKGCGFLMSANYLESIFILTGKFWPAKYVVKNNPVIHLNDEEMKQSIENNNYLTSKLKQPHTEHYHEMIEFLLRSMIFDFYDILAPKLQMPAYKYTSAENIFVRFMKMAEEETPRQREVGYYSNKLCITSKYLSTICKESCGKTASNILNAISIEKIKTQLRSSDKSIKEIANDMGFENLSFFGKYVKRELGVSPREYRNPKGE